MASRHGSPVRVERVQTGVRIEKRILKVLKGLAEYLDLTLGDLLEGIALHVFEGQSPFSPRTLVQVSALRKIYGLELSAKHSHRLVEAAGQAPRRSAGKRARHKRERRQKRS